MSGVTPARFPHLFRPLRLGPVEAPNRIVSSGHDTVMVDNGLVTDQLIAYHEARARGGAGCIVIQVAGVHETARYTSHVLMATSDECIPGYRALAGAVHPFGTVLLGQLFHPGREVMESVDGSAPVAVAPSAIPTERFRVTPRALRGEEVAEIVAGYGAAAERLIRAGLDGVEVVASHGYLPAQFLSPHVNRREDAYGGSRENRRRFLDEVMDAVRAGAGPAAAVGLRISLDEHDPAGLDVDEATEAVVALAARGVLDYVSVTTGTSATLGGSDHIAPDMGFANGYVAPAAARLRTQVDVPILVAGRINQPQEAERILSNGQADACVMTRALICDPEMPRRAVAGELDDIRSCVGCNQACIGHFHQGHPISCIQRPETGRERRYGTVVRTRDPRRVLVVGGGPAGLKAAAVAASRGHAVRLYEAGRRVGGQVLLAERLPGREEFGGVADNLRREAQRAGVEIIVGQWVDADLVERDDPEVVIVATGARPYTPPVERQGSPRVVDAWSVVHDVGSAPDGHVLVADSRGEWTGLGVARLLARAGRRVTLAVTGYAAGDRLQQYVRDGQLVALEREGVVTRPLLRLGGVDEDTAYLESVLTGSPVLVEDVDGVVVSAGGAPDAALAEALRERGRAPIVVGDARAPRTVEEAVLDGLVAASDL